MPRDPAVLLPLPTRRSSDLILDGEQYLFAKRLRPPVPEELAPPGQVRQGHRIPPTLLPAGEPGLGARVLLGRAGEVARSEEQTSELQSPDQLVCPLPLEKKK